MQWHSFGLKLVTFNKNTLKPRGLHHHLGQAYTFPSFSHPLVFRGFRVSLWCIGLPLVIELMNTSLCFFIFQSYINRWHGGLAGRQMSSSSSVCLSSRGKITLPLKGTVENNINVFILRLLHKIQRENYNKWMKSI